MFNPSSAATVFWFIKKLTKGTVSTNFPGSLPCGFPASRNHRPQGFHIDDVE